MKTMSQSIQMRLSLDEGLKNIWNYLAKEYKGLDKASIVRLALNTLAKTTRKQELLTVSNVLEVLEKLKTNEKGMNEDEFFKWWNTSKSSL
ncbi:MAG: hypothetical protein Q7R95_08365 [bacterium]|nr:hypothetical protein [bacterium]